MPKKKSALSEASGMAESLAGPSTPESGAGAATPPPAPAAKAEAPDSADTVPPPQPIGNYAPTAALPFAALPGYMDYPTSFSDDYFGAAKVVQTVIRLKARGFTRNNLFWGEYQKKAPERPEDEASWDKTSTGKGKRLYRNWEAAVAEARRDLRKQAAPPTGPDPDNPSMRADNALDHLDKAVRLALFDKHQSGSPADSGIPLTIKVFYATERYGRHSVSTAWQPAGGSGLDPKYRYSSLVITMTCPNGGWVGTATWEYTGTQQLKKFTATYFVPDKPAKDDDQILFIFNGLESKPDTALLPDRPSGILQPVLQWTPASIDPRSADWEGWAVRSWYVPTTYKPDFDQMPKLADSAAFNGAKNVAYTAATKVFAGDKLVGTIEWDGSKYVSKFAWTHRGQTATVASLPAKKAGTPDILPLVYVSAVIEAYRKKGVPATAPFDKKNLVNAVAMTDIRLEAIDGSKPEPTWNTGRDDPTTPEVEYGTNRLNYYAVDVTYETDAAGPKTRLDFTYRKPKAQEEQGP